MIPSDKNTSETNREGCFNALITHRRNCKTLRDLLKVDGWVDGTRRVQRVDDTRVAIPVIQDQGVLTVVKSLKFEALPTIVRLPKAGDAAVAPSQKLMMKMKKFVEENGNPSSWTNEMERECQTLGWERHGDMVVLHENAFGGQQWIPFHCTELWRTVADALSAHRLAARNRISNDNFRSPQVRLLLGCADDPWVTHVDNGVKYSFDITRSMFSAGNISEKLRLSRMDCSQQIVVDMFAGIGYFTLPYLIHAKAKFVHACEWNPDAVNALKRNLKQNGVEDRCQIHQGDNRHVAPVGVAQRVNLGLIPSSEMSWEASCRALDPDTGGILHVHSNVTYHDEDRLRAYSEMGQRVKDDIQRILNGLAGTENRGRSWNVTVLDVIKVKSYAPRIHHVVCDVECQSSFNITS